MNTSAAASNSLGVTGQSIDPTGWIRDLVCLAFDEGEARERILLDLIGQFTRLQPDDPEWFRYKLSLVEYQAIQKIGDQLRDVLLAQNQLRAAVRDLGWQAETNLRQSIKAATDESQQYLEDIRSHLQATLTGDSVVKMYAAETHAQFGQVVNGLMLKQLEMATQLITERMNKWITESIDESIKQVGVALTAATKDFRVRLYGAWSGLLWAMISGGVIAGLTLFGIGWWLGRH